MPLKYYCPKCEKRFVDWGAEKLGFKCPECEDETLYRVGTQPDGDAEAPTLSKSAAKRKTKAAAKPSKEDNPPVEGAGKDSAGDGGNDLDGDVDMDDGDDSDVIGDSFAIDDDD